MIPSSSSQLARYGSISHYKKFWLLQTQLEKQEQCSSSSSTLSLSTASATPPSAGHAIVKENSKTSSLICHHPNIDAHNAIVAASQHGVCRVEMAASSSNIGRVSNGSPALAYCPSEPACVRPYFCDKPAYCLQSANVLLSTVRNVDGSPFSLAVTCADTESFKTANRSWQSGSSQLDFDHRQRQIAGRLGAPEVAETCKSFMTHEVEKRACSGPLHCSLSEPSDHQPKTDGQIHVVSEFHHSRDPLLSHNVASSSNGYIRTCSLCGTTRTPLWRSGPAGPKSLCNACGIRVKKTKRLEAALQATSGSSPISPSSMSVFKGALKRKFSSEAQKDFTFHKKKRSTSVFSSPYGSKQKDMGYSKKLGGFGDKGGSLQSEHSGKRPAYDFAEDVEEAAVLLMALSCGLVLS